MLTHTVGAVAIWSESELIGRVVEHELLARLPGWRVTVCDPAEPLSRRIVAGATLAVVCTGGRPPAWLTGPVVLTGIRVADPVSPALAVLASRAAIVAVRDPISRDRLLAAGVAGDIDVLPHPGLLVGHAVDLDSLPARSELLRRLGVLPADGEYTVVSHAGLEAPDAGQVVALPAELGLEDRLAAQAGARTVISTDDEAAALHAAMKPLRDKGSTLSGHFDRIAALAGRALADHGANPCWAPEVLAAENAAIRSAHRRQRERQLVERQRLIEPNARLLLDLRDALIELATVRQEHAALSARLAESERELRQWRDTKLVRWTRPLRSIYARLRTR